MSNPLLKITIQPFNNQILIANKMQAKAYIKGKKTPKLPQYLSSKIGIDYAWNDKNKLVDIKTGAIVPSNKNKAGLPRMWSPSFQSLYNGGVKDFARASYMEKMKDFILPYIEDREFIEEVDLGLELKFYLEKKGGGKHNLDVDNISSIWFKTILDAMKGVIIRDDDTSVVTGLKSSISFVNEEETKLDILIWKR